MSVRRCATILTAGIVLLAAGVLAIADAPGRPACDCRWRTRPIVLDGRPDEEAWRGAQWVADFWDLGAGTADASRSRAACLWDEQGIFVAAVLQDGELFARVTRHDGDTWNDDVFELFLQPPGGFSDRRRAGKPYYEFEVNALNTVFDLLIDGTGDQKRDFLTGISRDAFHVRSAVHLDGTLDDAADHDRSWSVEAFIPWSDFAQTGGRPVAGSTWAGILARYDYPATGRDPRITASAPMTLARGFHDPARWMAIRFCAPGGAP